VRNEENAEGREVGEVESIVVVYGIIAHVGHPWCSSVGSSRDVGLTMISRGKGRKSGCG